MIERVLLVAWKGSPAASWLPALRSRGFTVLLEERTGARAWRTAKERGIDCVIIDGLKMVSHGRQTGSALRDTAKTRDIPIIWTNLHEDDAAVVQAEVKPDVLLPVPTDADSALAALMALAGEQDTRAVSRSAVAPGKPRTTRATKALPEGSTSGPAGARTIPPKAPVPARKKKRAKAPAPSGSKGRTGPLSRSTVSRAGTLRGGHRAPSAAKSRVGTKSPARARASHAAKREG